MSEETWHEARLIPTSGISGADEQERRATSALLAVMSVVREFSRALMSPLGAIAGPVETFIEVPFDLADKRVQPDGLIRVTRGAKTWSALVEVKTGKNELRTEQLENYLDVAREQGFDALITISNEIPAVAGQHPTAVDKRKLKRVALHHLSWSQILATAVMQKEHRGVSDPEQAWILGELIRYLEHPRSGAMELEDMGPHWVPVREAITAGTLRAADKGAAEVAARFDALIRFVSLHLGRRLGTEVLPVLSRRELADPSIRSQSLLESLVSSGELNAAIRIPTALAPIDISADLRAGQLTCSVDIDAPREGRQLTRINWLIRQLKTAPDTTRIEAFVLHGRGAGAVELLGKLREDPSLLVPDGDRQLRAFRVSLSGPAGPKRNRGRGAFIDSVIKVVDDFYTSILQGLKASATAAKLRDEPTPPPEVKPPALVSTALSSQDGPEPPTAKAESHT